MSTGNRMRLAALTAIVAVGSSVSPLAALHPGHDHAGWFGGPFHVILGWAAIPLLLASLGAALLVRRRGPR